MSFRDEVGWVLEWLLCLRHIVVQAPAPVSVGRGCSRLQPLQHLRQLPFEQLEFGDLLLDGTQLLRHTKEGWEHLFSSMIAVPKEQSAVLAAYLATHFPEKGRPGAVVLPGSTVVSIQEWLVPTLGSRPHDPFAAADGSI